MVASEAPLNTRRNALLVPIVTFYTRKTLINEADQLRAIDIH
jgi:hypothetical protein